MTARHGRYVSRGESPSRSSNMPSDFRRSSFSSPTPSYNKSYNNYTNRVNRISNSHNLPSTLPSLLPSSSSSSSRFQKRVSRFLPSSSLVLNSKPPPSFGISYSNLKPPPSPLSSPHSRSPDYSTTTGYRPHSKVHSHYETTSDNAHRCVSPYLTSRATSPKAACDQKSLSIPSAEQFPTTETTRTSKQVHNNALQVDSDDMEKSSKDENFTKLEKKEIDILNIMDDGNNNDNNTSSKQSTMTKQSGFVPKRREYTRNNEDSCINDNSDNNIITNNDNYNTQSIHKNEDDQKHELNRSNKNSSNNKEDYTPKQSSFVDRKTNWTDQEDVTKKPVNSNLTLQESLQKVRSWKEQQQQVIRLRKFQVPDYKDEDDDEEWRKRRTPAKRATLETSPEIIDEHCEEKSNKLSMNTNILNGSRGVQKSRNGEISYETNHNTFENDGNNKYTSDDLLKVNTQPIHTPKKNGNDLSNETKSTTNSQDTTATNFSNKRKDSLPCLMSLLDSKNGAFIGGLKDIDSLLSFNDTEGAEEEEEDEVQVSSWVDDSFVEPTVDIDDLLDEDLTTNKTTPEVKATPKVNSRFLKLSTNPFMRQTSQMVSGDLNDDEDVDEEEEELNLEECERIVHNLEIEAIESCKFNIGSLISVCHFSENSVRYRKLNVKLKKEQKFSGFDSMKESLEFLKIDVNKLEVCSVQLYHRLSKHNTSADNNNIDLDSLKLHSGIDDDDDVSDEMIKMATRVHSFIEMLLANKEIRKMLFSLKKIFKNEAGCIKEFVHSDGLLRLVEIAQRNSSNSTYACYILRGIGQVMLNVDGMNGVVSVNTVVQWLYKMIASNSVQVVKTVLRLLLMFVCHSECNSFLFIQAVNSVSKSKGTKTFSILIDLLLRSHNNDFSQWTGAGLYAMVLINKTIGAIPDLDNFYNVVDDLYELGLDKVFLATTNAASGVQDFLEQIKIFESSVKDEDIRQLIKQQGQQPQQEQQQDLGTSRKRIQSKVLFRRSIYFSKKEDLLTQEMNKRNQIKKNEQIKVLKESKKELLEKNKLTLKVKEGEKKELVEKPKQEIIKSKEELKWEEIENEVMKKVKVRSLNDNLSGSSGFSGVTYLRSNSGSGGSISVLRVKDMEFTDLTEIDDVNYLMINSPKPFIVSNLDQKIISPPPLPPPMQVCVKTSAMKPPPPPPFMPSPPLPLPPPLMKPLSAAVATSKTHKLHWKEASGEFDLPSGRKGETIWGKISKEVGAVGFDREEYLKLFQSKTTELKLKDTNTSSKKDLKILDAKRSNLINIALTALPQPSLIKTAILKMDETIMGKEAVEKILNNLLPSEDEKSALIEAQLSQPNLVLGPAESFLLTISNVSEIQSRLKLWLFLLDFENVETEICEALNKLRSCMVEVRSCETFKYALLVLLAVGNCLNSTQAIGFTLDFLSKVADIKDTVKKKPLLHHLIYFVSQAFPTHTDIFSEFEAVNALCKTDWDEVQGKLQKLEEGCKDSWNHVKRIVKHNNDTALKNKLSLQLNDYADRIVVLKRVYKRINNKFRIFLLEFGYHASEVNDCKTNEFCKSLVDFSLIWRSIRSKILYSVRKKEMEKEKLSNSINDINNINNNQSLKNNHGNNNQGCINDNEYDEYSDSNNKMKYLLKNKFKSNGSVSENESIKSKKPPIFPTLNNTTPHNNNYNNINNFDNTLSVSKFQRWPSTMSLGNGSETESAYDTGDEDLLDAAIRTKNRSSNHRRPSRDRRRASIGKSSQWRSESRDREISN